MVSVLVPVYNAEKFLDRCVESILKQTYSDFELILANDGSTDLSLARCMVYANRDSRVKVFNHENVGVAATRSKLLDAATGNYIIYIDADDWIEENMFERMIQLSQDRDIVFCGRDFARNRQEIEHVNSLVTEEWNQKRQMLEFMRHKHMTGCLWNKMIKREVIGDIRFNEQTGYGEDAEFLWSVLKRSESMVVTNEILYHHVLEDSSISHLSFSMKKYTAIPMWEKIVSDVRMDYPELLKLANERLVSTAVYSMYEIHQCGYKNEQQTQYMRKLIRYHIIPFICSKNISVKFKLYALAICVGY